MTTSPLSFSASSRSPSSLYSLSSSPPSSSSSSSPASHSPNATTLERILEHTRNRPWQDHAFVIVLIIILIKTFLLLSPLQQLPSPLYGGDVYFHFGVINHIYTGNAPWMHNHFLNEYAHYPWIMHLLVAIIAWVTRINILTTAIYFPLVTTTLAAIISYLLGITVFSNRSIALLFALFWSTFQVPNTAASPFGELVMYPLFLLMLSRSLKKSDDSFAKSDDSLASRIICGIAFGLTGLAQVITWIGAIMSLGFLWMWKIGSETIIWKESRLVFSTKGFFPRVWKHTRWFIPIVIVGLPIALLFWGPPLFIYHGKTPNNWSDYVSVGPTLTPSIALDTIRIWFFNTDNWKLAILSIGTLLGFILACRTPNRFLIPFITGLVPTIGFLHPLIKEIGIGFYAFGYIYDSARGLLFFTLIYVVYKSLSKHPRTIFYAIVAIFLVVNAQATFDFFENDRWVQVGRTPNQQYPFAQWIMANTPLDSVFLTSHEETGFALNAMTGRKVLVARRTHASPFVDVNQRAADAAVILYGTNESLSKELVKQYHLKYVYDDFYAIQNQGVCTQVFEHLENPAADDASMACLRTDPARESYINAAGITTVKVHARLDPASSVAPLFDMIAIKPTGYSAWITNHTILVRQTLTQDQAVYQRLWQIRP